MFVGILVTTERPLIGAFLPSSMIVRLVSEILCKGIRDFLSGISEQGTGNSGQGSGIREQPVTPRFVVSPV